MSKPLQYFFCLLAAGILILSGSGCTAKIKKARHLSRADKYFAAGDFSKAEVEYLNVLRLDPQNSKVMGQLGTIYLDEGLPIRALPFLTKGSQLATNDLDLRTRLGTACLAIGVFKEAHDQALFVLGKMPTNADAPSLLSESVTNKAQADEVREQFKAYIAKAGDNAAIQVAYGGLDLREGDVKSAEAAFTHALTLDPKSSAAHFGMGTISLGKNDLKTAETELKTASELSPLRSVRRLQYAEFKLRTGELDEGKRLLGEITKAAPDYVPAWMRQAEIALSEKRYEDCNSLLTRILSRDSANYDGTVLKSRLLVAKGEPAKAVAELERVAAVGFYGRLPQLHYQLAASHLANTNDYARAITSLDKAILLYPNYDDAILLLAQINISRGETTAAIAALNSVVKRQPRMPQVHLELASAYAAKGDLESALGEYRRLGELYPKNPETPFRVGSIYLQQNRKSEARESFTRVLELVPDYVPAIERLVDLDLMDEQYSNAFTRVQLLIPKSPKAPEPHLLLAKIHLGEAAALVNAALKQEKENNLPASDPNLLMAKIPLAQTNSDLAEAEFLKALELNPSLQEPYLLLARLYVNTKREQKALDKLSAALSKDPKDTSALMLMATIQEQAKDYSAARASYEKLLQIDPSFYSALNNLAYLYSEKFDELDKAYELARKARAELEYHQQPGENAAQTQQRNTIEFLRAFSSDTLGWIVFKRGDYPYALTLLKEASGKLGLEPEVQFHLGMAGYMLGQEQLAQAAFERALQLNKEFAGKEETSRRLRLLAIDPKNVDSKTVASLENELDAHPEDPVALARVTAFYDREQTPEKAVRFYEGALKKNPGNVPVLLKLANLNSDQLKNPQRALELAKTANKLAPDNPAISSTLGRLVFRSGDYKWALSLLEQGRPAQEPEALSDLAMAYYSGGRFAEAEAAMKAALQANPTTARAAEDRRFLDLLPLSMDATRALAGETQITDRLKSAPDDPLALMGQGLCAVKHGNSSAARDAFERILVRFPDFTPACKYLAVLYGDLGDNQKSYEMAARARDAFPADAEVAKALGIATYLRNKDYRNSARLLDEGVRKGNEDGKSLYYLGMAHYQLKELGECKKALEKALTLEVDSKLADNARQVLAELKKI